jgi:hypothetical protein
MNMCGKYLKGGGRGLLEDTVPAFALRDWRKHRNFNDDSRQPDRDSKGVKAKVKLSLKTYCGGGGIAPRILDVGARRRGIVSSMPRPLYPR